MTLYFRLICILLKIWRTQKQTVLTASRLSFRVYPLDCDFNLHLTNSRYFSFMDLGRFHLMGQVRLLKLIYRKRWMAVITATEISFIRAIKPWQQFDLITQVIAWEGPYVFIEQRFEHNGKLMATAYVKGTFLGAGEKIEMAKVMAELGEQTLSPPLPNAIRHWLDLAEAKKNQTTNVQ